METVIREITLADEAATIRLGTALAGLLRAGDVIALSGGLGSGKTVLARACVRALAAKEGRDEVVPSPTFTLVQAYEFASLTVYHFDLYRISLVQEVLELGWDDALDTGAILVEWPERLGALLPEERLDIALAYGHLGAQSSAEQAARNVTLSGFGRWSSRLEELMRLV